MGWGCRSKYRTSSYSNDFEFIFFCFKCILVLLARLSSGELHCSATALIVKYCDQMSVVGMLGIKKNFLRKVKKLLGRQFTSGQFWWIGTSTANKVYFMDGLESYSIRFQPCANVIIYNIEAECHDRPGISANTQNFAFYFFIHCKNIILSNFINNFISSDIWKTSFGFILDMPKSLHYIFT